MKRCFLIGTGFLSLGLGVVGVFLPVLPTTPFLLLSAWCFLRSSKRLYRWITGHRLFGPYIVNYLRYRAVTVKAKLLSIVLLWVVILSTVVFAVEAFWLRLLLTAIAVAVSVHLATMRTLTRGMIERSSRESRDEGA
jgi:uncharacterized membrane protein YbaN (DUF454 family)